MSGEAEEKTLERQLSDSGKGYEKSHRDQLSCLVSEIAPCLCFSLKP